MSTKTVCPHCSFNFSYFPKDLMQNFAGFQFEFNCPMCGEEIPCIVKFKNGIFFAEIEKRKAKKI